MQIVYQFLTWPFALLSYYFLKDTREKFDGINEMRKYHFNYEYDLEHVLLCYFVVVPILPAFVAVKMAHKIDKRITGGEK